MQPEVVIGTDVWLEPMWDGVHFVASRYSDMRFWRLGASPPYVFGNARGACAGGRLRSWSQ